MSGEAYFEVAANKGMPFVVQKVHDGMEVQVLGTHFNVNAYDDEEKLKVTLLEGKVSVKKARASVLLAPGQQAQVNAGGTISLMRDADTAAAVAWKNELFSFRGVGLKEVMRQLSRWYDVDVRYEGDMPDMQFNGEIGRNVPLKDVLDGVTMSRIHYRLEEGRRLVIMP
jgi:ferric-dicitrate binding protein FerR (iron transport regulator)